MSQKEKANTMEVVKLSEVSEALKKATGIIPYTFLNDYMFRVILQKHKNVLRSVVCACLKLKANIYPKKKRADKSESIETIMRI